MGGAISGIMGAIGGGGKGGGGGEAGGGVMEIISKVIGALTGGK